MFTEIKLKLLIVTIFRKGRKLKDSSRIQWNLSQLRQSRESDPLETWKLWR